MSGKGKGKRTRAQAELEDANPRCARTCRPQQTLTPRSEGLGLCQVVKATDELTRAVTRARALQMALSLRILPW